jgi:hypothetical protein
VSLPELVKKAAVRDVPAASARDCAESLLEGGVLRRVEVASDGSVREIAGA